MRVIIADDEYLVQESLISMIAEFPDGWSIVGVASDGKELVDLILEHKPDLAIVDIKMPYISGIEAIRMTRNQCPSMQWIVLTGYSEFTFAQEALKLGAANYLLKPIDRDELERSLETTKQTLRKQNEFMSKRFESVMNAICHGLGSDLMEEEVHDFALASVSMFVFLVDSCLQENEQAIRLRHFYKKLKDLVHLRMESNTRHAFIFLPNGDLALICSYTQTPGHTKMLDGILRDIDSVMEEMIADQVFCLTMITTESHSYDGIKEQLDNMQAVSALRIAYGVNRKWTLNELLTNKEESILSLCDIVLKLVKYHREHSHAIYMNGVNELKTVLDSSTLLHQDKYKRALGHFINSTIPCSVSSKDPYAVWIQQLKEDGQRLLTQIRKVERPQDLIARTLLFIENNYVNDISILQIADELQVTPNYLSTLFHKKMGATFIKYLTRIRLMKAQELLKNPHSQVQTVAEMVGYTNPRYFTRLFTEFVGCYPSDYRKKHLIE